MSRSVPRINVCGLTRLLVPAYAVAIVVSTFTGSDALALVAAVVTAGAIALVQRARGTTPTCALPPVPREAGAAASKTSR